MKSKNSIAYFGLSILACLAYIWIGYGIDRESFFLLFGLYSFCFFIGLLLSKQSENISWQLLFFIGLIFRLSLFWSVPNLSDDYARFLWDGELLGLGSNPYEMPPKEWMAQNQELISSYLEKLFQLMNSKGYFSIYPPSNQLIFWFAGLVSDSQIIYPIIILRLVLVSAEMGVFFLLRKLLLTLKLSSSRIGWYWLNPLAILEISGNLHFEGLVLASILGALFFISRSNVFGTSASLFAGVGIKLVPLILLPSLFFDKNFRKKPTFWLGGLLIFFLAFSPLIIDQSYVNLWESIRLYQGKFEFNGSVYYLLREVGFWIQGYNTIATLTKILSLTTFVLIIWFSVKNSKRDTSGIIRLWVSIYLIYLFLQPVVHPWYLLPVLGLSVLINSRTAILWSWTIIFSYQAYGNIDFYENPLFLWIEYVPVFLLVFWEFRQNKLNYPFQVSQNEN
ncbi:carotene biosynthesis protein [Algoriphagus sediminis]|uniref:Carotene biosynthesis protein n=1 Tax=Algoriphagus sediminis TaxID=3057113 RepID=A0ABT7Y8A7_9BACT|nr:carotene biosynthesis protein [Algoriphagus sediminis]MDN3202708.1 carotene biosynthesis protein [Algoriphagus sediminis]